MNVFTISPHSKQGSVCRQYLFLVTLAESDAGSKVTREQELQNLYKAASICVLLLCHFKMRYFLLESTLSVKLYSFASYAASLKQSLRPLPIVCITSKTFKFCRSFFVGNCIFQYFVDKVLFSIEKHLKCNFFLNLIESSDISTTHLPFSDVRENYLLFSTFEPISM